MTNPKLEDFTKNEFTKFIKKIMTVDYPSERAHDNAVLEFARISEHPDGWDLIYHPKDINVTAEQIVEEISDWRRAEGKTDFKAE